MAVSLNVVPARANVDLIPNLFKVTPLSLCMLCLLLCGGTWPPLHRTCTSVCGSACDLLTWPHMDVLWVGAPQLSVNLSDRSTTKTQGAAEGVMRGAGRFAAWDTEDKER